jgi:hypothetical protein
LQVIHERLIANQAQQRVSGCVGHNKISDCRGCFARFEFLEFLHDGGRVL